LSGCLARIADDQGNEFEMQETEPGTYTVWMGKESLQPGRAFQVMINTPSGEILSSDYDTLAECPPIDTVYYMLEEHLTPDPSVVYRGIQFYLDLDGNGFNSHYYKWDLIETWEYHAAHHKEFYYDGAFHQIYPPDSSTMFCWTTKTVNNIFTLSTQNLSENAYRQFPLHFVDGNSSKLGVLYSVMLQQYSLSEAAYNFWEQLKVNSYEQSGLYEKQPMDIKGNVRETSGSGREVLGIFYAASIRTKRIFVQNVEGLELDFTNFCSEESLGRFGWREFGPNDYPVYYFFPPGGGLLILSDECVECELMGGSLIKPDFWPQ
jgi:hypothetical protein